MRFGHNFWLGGPIDLRSMRLNCILQDLFRDTPHNHIQMRAYTVYGATIWVCQIWSSRASLKKILQNTVQTRWSFGSVGPPIQKLWSNLIFARTIWISKIWFLCIEMILYKTKWWKPRQPVPELFEPSRNGQWYGSTWSTSHQTSFEVEVKHNPFCRCK